MQWLEKYDSLDSRQWFEEEDGDAGHIQRFDY